MNISKEELKELGYNLIPVSEIKIEKILKNNDIRFKPQYKYEGLFGLGGGLLSYDFYLPDYNLLIEYQGEYHDGTARNTIDANEIMQKNTILN